MKTRIKVIKKGSSIIYHAQIRYDFCKGFGALTYLIPILGQIIFICDLFWTNMQIYYEYSSFGTFDATFYDIGKCKEYIDRYIKCGCIPDKKPEKSITYIKYP